ncbi:MAG: hypothetical protein HY864_14555 [Chloroflexi bacterium]|nr:hypothetical protein [Chloroflexota bacterium]
MDNEKNRNIENENHPSNHEGFFMWPSTHAPASKHGFNGDVFFYRRGLLSYVGYRVGQQGISKNTRLQILDCVFHKNLPRVDSPEYMEEWGDPKTAARLKKLAETLAALIRNAKRRANSNNLSEAISDWEADLKYLYSKYYIDWFDFVWPPNE